MVWYNPATWFRPADQTAAATTTLGQAGGYQGTPRTQQQFPFIYPNQPAPDPRRAAAGIGGAPRIPMIGAQPAAQPNISSGISAGIGQASSPVNISAATPSNKLALPGRQPNQNLKPAREPSFHDINKRYQYDFFTPEGQKERLANVRDVLNEIRPFGGSSITANISNPALKGAAEFAADKPFEAALYATGTAQLYKTVAARMLSMDRIGSIALSQGGSKTLASAMPEAAGMLAKTAAGKIAANTATKAGGIKAVTDLLTMKGGLRSYAVVGAIVWAFSGAKGVENEKGQFIEDAGKLAVQLKDAGMNGEAEELARYMEDLRDGWDIVTPYIPLIGGSSAGEQGKIDKMKDRLSEIVNSYQAKANDDNSFAADINAKIKAGQDVSLEDLARAARIDPDSLANQKLLSTQAIEENKANIETQRRLISRMMPMSDEDILNDPDILTAVTDDANQGSLFEQMYQAAYNRFYAQLNQEEQRTYEQRQTEEARKYQEQKTAEARAYAKSQEPPPPQPSISDPSSTLNFGLLRAGGGGSGPAASSGGAPGAGAPATGPADTGAQPTSTAGVTEQSSSSPAAANKDAIALFLFGKRYIELTPDQQGVVDKW